RSKRRHFDSVAPIAAVPARSSAAIAARRAIARPDPGEVVLVESLAIIRGIVRHDAAATLRERRRRYQKEKRWNSGHHLASHFVAGAGAGAPLCGAPP